MVEARPTQPMSSNFRMGTKYFPVEVLIENIARDVVVSNAFRSKLCAHRSCFVWHMLVQVKFQENNWLLVATCNNNVSIYRRRNNLVGRSGLKQNLQNLLDWGLRLACSHCRREILCWKFKIQFSRGSYK